MRSKLNKYLSSGSWHGVYREWDKEGDLIVYGKCRNGKLSGKCWKFYSGGGALYGDVGFNNKISGEKVAYLYPDFITGIQVNWKTIFYLNQ